MGSNTFLTGGSRKESLSLPFLASKGHPHSFVLGPLPLILKRKQCCIFGAFLLKSHLLLTLIFFLPYLFHFKAAAAAKSLQSCPTLCDPIDGSPPGSPCPWDSPGKNIGVGCHFLLQCMKVKSESEVAQSCPTAAYQAPPPMRFARQEYGSGVPLSSPPL